MSRVSLSVLTTFLIFFLFTQSTFSNEKLSNIQITKILTSMSLAFTANEGQWDEKVSFRANAGGATMWFATDGAYYQFNRIIKTEDNEPISIVDKLFGMMPEDGQPDSIEVMMIKAHFVGSNANSIIRGIEELEYRCNYFIGNEPNEWHTDVPNFSAVMYEDVYDGIDLKYYGNGKQMEYDFIVSPGADYSQINIQYEGAESITVNDNGELVVTTKWGEVIEQRPVIYQLENDRHIPIEGSYKLQGENSFGFELSNYNISLPLVIDPVLNYSTYLGGSDIDQSRSIAVDDTGTAYVIGSTSSTNFPTLNPYQESLNIDRDVFVSKLNNTGNHLVYSTYIGGTGREAGVDITVDSLGMVYILGRTTSLDFPTSNPYQEKYQGDDFGKSDDTYITKLSSSGNSLIYSTYLGGNNDDLSYSITVDNSGAAYVTGWTNSTNFPTHNPFQETYQGNYDVFVTKLSNLGNSLIFSTYLGGSTVDYGFGIAVDSNGEVYITGQTGSYDFPILNPIQNTNHGVRDAFVTKLSRTGNSLVYSTYLGGSERDGSMGIEVDVSGNVYIMGHTNSIDFPILNPFEGTYNGGSYDVFVTKLNSIGNNMIYSTYLGGSNDDRGFGIAIDTSGAAFITGITASNDFPILNPFQGNFNGGSFDVFVTKLSSIGHSLIYSTYFGGSNTDYGFGIAIDTFGAAYISGESNSTDFPTFNPFQGTNQGSSDAFVIKFSSPSCCIGVRGDINNDEFDSFDISDIAYLVNYLFKDGPPIFCAEETDVVIDGIINLSDLIYFVDYIFTDGPQLSDCL